MSTVLEIRDYLLSLAPAAWKEDWDNVGLLCGRRDMAVSRILVALDVTMAVAQEAVEKKAQLIVSHHPLLFSVQSLSDESATGRLILHLASHNIAVISLHTNLDSAPGGVNDCLAQRLGLENIRTFTGDPHGIGRIGEVPEQSLANFAAFAAKQLRTGGVRYACGGRSVRCVAVGGGSCIDFLPQAMRAGCDTFLTGDIKYHQFQKAASLGVNLIDAGHFPTEDPICEVLCQRLSAQFPEISTEKSEVHADCVKFIAHRC